VSDPWYADGLNFKCTECGQCCTGSPGYAWVSEKEIVDIADFLKLTVEEFSSRYIRKVGERYALLEMPKTFDCVFLKDKRCTIYQVRPKQCRTFPWWPQTLKSREDWIAASKQCEGIHPQAPKIPLAVIQEQLSIQENKVVDLISSKGSAERGKARPKQSGLNEEAMAGAMADEEDRQGFAAAGRTLDEIKSITEKEGL
jgi:uncharacterized protein